MRREYIIPLARALTKLPVAPDWMMLKVMFHLSVAPISVTAEIKRRTEKRCILSARGEDASGQCCVSAEVTLLSVPEKPGYKNEPSGACPQGAFFWRSFGPEEIKAFSAMIRDKNTLHTGEKPVVQGFFLLYELLELSPARHGTIRFFSPVFAAEEVFLMKKEKTIKGYQNERCCFIYESHV